MGIGLLKLGAFDQTGINKIDNEDIFTSLVAKNMAFKKICRMAIPRQNIEAAHSFQNLHFMNHEMKESGANMRHAFELKYSQML